MSARIDKDHLTVKDGEDLVHLNGHWRGLETGSYYTDRLVTEWLEKGLARRWTASLGDHEGWD